MAKNWFTKVYEVQWPLRCGQLDITDFSTCKEQ